jgi:hypothetical protein
MAALDAWSVSGAIATVYAKTGTCLVFAKLARDSGRVRPADYSPGNRAVDCIDEQLGQERLSQICDATGIIGSFASGLRVDGRHENDWQITARRDQLPLQLDAGNSAEVNVQDQTLRFAICDAVEKQLCRRERLDTEAMRQQKTIEALQQAWIVIDECYGPHDKQSLAA